MQPDEMVGQVLGHYRIMRPVGYGGSATVFLAQDINLQREVAIKIFYPREGETRDFLRRFAREARVLAQLDHPNILPVYDYGEENDKAYLIMPHVAGGSLRDRLQKLGSLPAQEVIQISSQVLGALQYAHDRGLVHRDIKPGNLLCKIDGTLLLSDFGLVKILPTEGVTTPRGETITVSTQCLAGTADYMAPEQIKGQATRASDIYSMGAVIYEMLTGSHLFTAENYMGILMQHLYEQPRPIRALKPQISPALEAVVMRALEKDPDRRYQSAADFRQALLQAGRDDDEAPTFISDQGATLQAPGSTALAPSPVIPHSELSSIPFTPLGSQPGSHPDLPPIMRQAHPTTQQPTPYPQMFQQSAGYYPVPTTPRPRNRQTPLIITLIMLMVVILISTASILYAQGVFGPLAGRAPTPRPLMGTPGGTVVNGNTGTAVTKGGATAVVGNGPNAPLMPATSTDCPPNNTARAAVMASMGLGTHQNIVYIVNEQSQGKPTFGTVKRRDMTTNTQGVEIAKMPNLRINDEQVSQDGQWVLFTAQVGTQSQLRLVRMDGQGLQTLYCGLDIASAQWSFNQRYVIFNRGPDVPSTYLLDITSGSVQQILFPTGNMIYIPHTWLDNSRVYVTAVVPGSDGPDHDLLILDIRKGTHQHDSDLQRVVTTTWKCGNFDSSYDSKQLFMSSCTPAPFGQGDGPDGPSTLTEQPATGGTAQTIYSNPIRAVTTVRAISPTTLLLMIENTDSTGLPANLQAQIKGDTSMNGLWRMNTDGTHLQRLTTDSTNSQSLCQFTQYAWSNVSRDDGMYAVQSFDPQKNEYTLSTGSMNGGPINTFADISDGTQLFLAGWTNM